MPKAADYHLPTILVRRLPDEGRIFHRGVYEVEFTALGSSTPAWRETTTRPRQLIEPHLGRETTAVLDAADRAWTGGVGPWTSLFDDDEPGAAPDGP